MHAQPAWDVGVDLFEERQHVGAGVTLAQIGQDLSGRNVHRGEQVDGAGALVIVSHGAGPPGLHRGATAGFGPAPGTGSSRRSCTPPPGSGIQVQPYNIDELAFKVRIIADLERLDLPRLAIVIGPDLGHGVLADADTGGQALGAPLRRPVRRTFFTGQPQRFL